MSGMAVYWRDYLGYSNFLDCSVPLYNFVAGDRFVNPGENATGPAGGMSMWKILQGKGDIRERMALVDADLSALDRRNAMADQITWVTKVHLQTI